MISQIEKACSAVLQTVKAAKKFNINNTLSQEYIYLLEKWANILSQSATFSVARLSFFSFENNRLWDLLLRKMVFHHIAEKTILTEGILQVIIAATDLDPFGYYLAKMHPSLRVIDIPDTAELTNKKQEILNEFPFLDNYSLATCTDNIEFTKKTLVILEHFPGEKIWEFLKYINAFLVYESKILLSFNSMEPNQVNELLHQLCVQLHYQIHFWTIQRKIDFLNQENCNPNCSLLEEKYFYFVKPENPLTMDLLESAQINFLNEIKNKLEWIHLPQEDIKSTLPNF